MYEDEMKRTKIAITSGRLGDCGGIISATLSDLEQCDATIRHLVRLILSFLKDLPESF